MFKGKVTRSPEDTTERDPDADDFGETTQSWRVEYEDQEQEDCNEPVLILTSIAMMTTLVSMERPPGSLSPITSQG